MIDPTARIPPYKQLAEIIRERINSGRYSKGSRLPSEAEFMEEFEIGRNTARRAVGELREAGLVETVRTRGSYVL
jgi:GntR family transcriptional regulator